MEPIDPQELATVTGGFAFLAALPGILSGVTGLVNAFKGNGSSPQAAPAQPPAAPPAAGAPPASSAPLASSTPPAQTASSGPSPTAGFDPMSMLSSVTNIIRIG